MARNVNGIDLQSTDPDLSVDAEYEGQGAAGDLMDYAGTVGVWGSDAADLLSVEHVPSPLAPSQRPCPPAPLFHSQHNLTAPFKVAAVVAVIILILVFVPLGGES